MKKSRIAIIIVILLVVLGGGYYFSDLGSGGQGSIFNRDTSDDRVGFVHYNTRGDAEAFVHFSSLKAFDADPGTFITSGLGTLGAGYEGLRALTADYAGKGSVDDTVSLIRTLEGAEYVKEEFTIGDIPADVDYTLADLFSEDLDALSALSIQTRSQALVPAADFPEAADLETIRAYRISDILDGLMKLDAPEANKEAFLNALFTMNMASNSGAGSISGKTKVVEITVPGGALIAAENVEAAIGLLNDAASTGIVLDMGDGVSHRGLATDTGDGISILPDQGDGSSWIAIPNLRLPEIPAVPLTAPESLRAL